MIRRCFAIVLVAGCGSAPASIANTAAPPESSWPDRVRELCAPLGSDAARGLSAVTLRGVSFGDEIPQTSGYSGGAQQTWKIASPRPYHVIGIASRRPTTDTPTGFHLADNSVITAIWIRTEVSPRDICAALALPVTNGSCKRTDGDRLLLVSIEDADTRVACGQIRAAVR